MSKANQPYIFISYAHKDKELIDPFITALKEKYEVWFDEGIRYGREWEEEIAAKLDECSIFMFAVTENSLDSKNCRDELTLARDTDKHFLNVVFSEDIEFPSWFRLRYSRYQMCEYYRFPSARAVVDDLGQKCEWFEDVKLPALQSAEQEEAEDISLKDVATEKETADKTSDEVQNPNINREQNKDVSAQSVIPPSVQVTESNEKEQCEKQMTEAVKYAEKKTQTAKSATETRMSDLQRITRKDVINAVSLSNYKNRGKGVTEFTFFDQLKTSQIENIIKKIAPLIPKESIVAFFDDSLFKSGKSGILVTDYGLYYSYYKKERPVILSKIKSVKMVDDTHIEITYNDSTTERKFYSIYALRVYDIIDALTG